MKRLTPEEYHVPVMLAECIKYLDLKQGGVYVDATLGGGGHFMGMQSALARGTLIGFDADENAIARCEQRLSSSEYRVASSEFNIELIHSNFDQIPEFFNPNSIRYSELATRYSHGIDGILFDLGVSSFQFDHHSRGFSYRMEGPLDMRFTPQGETAADVLNTRSVEELTHMLRVNADEPKAWQLAQAIEKRRRLAPFKTISDVRDLIAQHVPPQHQPKTIARLFQALRIEVNQELDRLRLTLEGVIPLLNIGGRVVVMSYHSGEDRIVKEIFKRYSSANSEVRVEILTKKPIEPSAEEQKTNPRSRSARLRAAARIA